MPAEDTKHKVHQKLVSGTENREVVPQDEEKVAPCRSGDNNKVIRFKSVTNNTIISDLCS